MNKNTGPPVVKNATHTSSFVQTENASLLLKNNTHILIQTPEHEASASTSTEMRSIEFLKKQADEPPSIPRCNSTPLNSKHTPCHKPGSTVDDKEIFSLTCYTWEEFQFLSPESKRTLRHLVQTKF